MPRDQSEYITKILCETSFKLLQLGFCYARKTAVSEILCRDLRQFFGILSLFYVIDPVKSETCRGRLSVLFFFFHIIPNMVVISPHEFFTLLSNRVNIFHPILFICHHKHCIMNYKSTDKYEKEKTMPT